MKTTPHKKFFQFLVISTAIAFALVAFLSLTHSSFGMQMNENNQMVGCVFDSKMQICSMTLTEHIQAWQRLLTTLPAQNIQLSFSALLLTGLSLINFIVWRKNLFDIKMEGAQKSRFKRRLCFEGFNFFREAFSQGILNPKIY